MPSRRSASGWKASMERTKSGLAKPPFAQGGGRHAGPRRIRAGAGSGGRGRRPRCRCPRPARPGGGRRAWTGRPSRPAPGSARSSSTASLSAAQWRSAAAGESVTVCSAAECGLGGPIDEVQPEGLVVELADAVVAEEVGVGEDDDAAGAVLCDGRDGRARTGRGGEGAGEDVAAVVEGERAGAVEAGLVHAGEEVDASGPRPRRRSAVGPVPCEPSRGPRAPTRGRCGGARSPGRWRSRSRCRSGRGGR